MKTLTLAQQKKAIAWLKKEVEYSDEQNPGQAGYCDEEDITEKRVFLIEIGAMKDRRGK